MEEMNYVIMMTGLAAMLSLFKSYSLLVFLLGVELMSLNFCVALLVKSAGYDFNLLFLVLVFMVSEAAIGLCILVSSSFTSSISKLPVSLDV